MKNKFRLHPKTIITISLIIGVVMIVSAYFELTESKKEIYRLLDKQSASLIETIRLASLNTLHSSDEIENLLAERLLDNARFIKSLDSSGILTEQKLANYGKMNSLFRINILNDKGERVLSNGLPQLGLFRSKRNQQRPEEITALLEGKLNEAVIGLKEGRIAGNNRFAVAVARANRKGAIIINLDAASLLAFRKKIGIGKIVQDIAENPGIVYIVLQDSGGVLTASKGITTINAIQGDALLQQALQEDKPLTREFTYRNTKVYEVIQQLKFEGETIGVFRIGLAMDEIKNLETRMIRRIIIISLLLAAISIIVLSIVFTMENLKSVSKELSKVKTFSGAVLENMGEAVIVINSDFSISLFNKQAEKLFGKEVQQVLGLHLTLCSDQLFSSYKQSVIDEKQNSFEFSTQTGNDTKYFSVTVSHGAEENESTLVIKDLTEQRRLEEQKKRNEKLSAMGELASGVAHEIRNPINAIGMIAHRLSREFAPNDDSAEFASITGVLKSEVERINKIITQFLSYAKPLELQKKKNVMTDFFNELYLLFKEEAEQKNITFTVQAKEKSTVVFDPELMKQVLMNLLQNAFDATPNNGTISLATEVIGNSFSINISDSGRGISEQNLSKIFNLYFTTRKDGNGLGLSIAQKIVNQHNGTIYVTSKVNEGTTFTITIPAYEKL